VNEYDFAMANRSQEAQTLLEAQHFDVIHRSFILRHPDGSVMGAPGPLMLQGDHGPMRFRNIVARPEQ